MIWVIYVSNTNVQAIPDLMNADKNIFMVYLAVAVILLFIEKFEFFGGILRPQNYL